MSAPQLTSLSNKIIDIDEAIQSNLRKQKFRSETSNNFSSYDNKNATCRIIPSTHTVMSADVTTRAQREIIKIDDTSIRLKNPNRLHNGLQKTKRKKGSLNEILSQLEAKKRKEVEKSKIHFFDPVKSSNDIYVQSVKSRVFADKQTDKRDDYEELYQGIYKDYIAPNDIHKNTILNSSLIANIQNEVKIRLESNEKSTRQYSSHVNTPIIDNNNRSLTTSPYSPMIFETKRDTDFQLKDEYIQQGKKKKVTSTTRYSTLSSTQLHRRLVANARERSRVHALSNAFDMLRSAIPSYSSEQKISKLTILHVAINYIKALQEVLVSDPLHIDENQVFVSHVNECSYMLQSEYGRSKFLPNDKK